MSEIKPILDHGQQAQNRLTSYHRSDLQNDFHRLVGKLAGHGQLAEDMLVAMLSQVNLDQAQSAQLDLVGKALHVSRPEGLSDEGYRVIIRNHFTKLRSSGEPEVLIATYKEMILSNQAEEVRALTRVKFEDWEEHQEPLVALIALTSEINLQASEREFIKKEMAKTVQSPNAVQLGVVEWDSFTLGTQDGQESATGLLDLRNQVQVFRLGTLEDQTTSFGLSNFEGEERCGFYGNQEDPTLSIPALQTNQDTTLAWLL